MYYSCSNKSQQLKQCSSKMYYILFTYQHVIGINVFYDDNVMFNTPNMYVSKNNIYFISYSRYVLYLKYCIKGMLGGDKL